MKLTFTVEAELEDQYLDPNSNLNEDLVGEAVSIKSGIYENMLWGNVVKVEVDGNN